MGLWVLALCFAISAEEVVLWESAATVHVFAWSVVIFLAMFFGWTFSVPRWSPGIGNWQAMLIFLLGFGNLAFAWWERHPDLFKSMQELGIMTPLAACAGLAAVGTIEAFLPRARAG